MYIFVVLSLYEEHIYQISMDIISSLSIIIRDCIWHMVVMELDT